MTPSFLSFSDELLLIKAAEADEPQSGMPPASAAPLQDEEKPFHSTFPATVKERLKSLAAYAPAYGLGAVGGAYLGQKALSKFLPQPWSAATHRNVRIAAGAMGGLSSLFALEALRRANQMERDAIQRDS